ncbi:type II secretion system protein N [Marinobacterium jannaschii]|uniref:type II secretion system protein N n=1 Tax=Marinobacterium jannaschii TaxID=64970 RepID=UPI000487838D|nr:type II secretion system protein N [Marinobacterium jannaschii]
MIRRLLILFIPAYLLGLILLLPVNTALQLLMPQELTPRPQLEQAEGTVWSGDSRSLKIAELSLNNLSWQADPLALASLDLGWRLRSDELEGRLRHSLISQQLSHIELQAPLSGLIPPAFGWLSAFGGELTASVEQPQQCDQAGGKLILSQLQLSDELSLPAISGELSCSENRYQLKLSDPSKQLGLSGTLVLNMDGRYTLNAKLRPKENAIRQQLEGLLGNSRNGSFSLNYSGRL